MKLYQTLFLFHNHVRSFIRDQTIELSFPNDASIMTHNFICHHLQNFFLNVNWRVGCFLRSRFSSSGELVDRIAVAGWNLIPSFRGLAVRSPPREISQYAWWVVKIRKRHWLAGDLPVSLFLNVESCTNVFTADNVVEFSDVDAMHHASLMHLKTLNCFSPAVKASAWLWMPSRSYILERHLAD